MYGVEGLKLLAKGLSPSQALNLLIQRDPHPELRQVGIIDVNNQKVAYTGSQCPVWRGHIIGENYIILGNLLVGPSVLEAMRKRFEDTKDSFILRLLNSLVEGEKMGGDRRGDRSAALIIEGKKSIRLYINYAEKPAVKLLKLYVSRYMVKHS